MHSEKTSIIVPTYQEYSMGIIIIITLDEKREDVSELSQLISRYLYDKPSEIDSNKIFNCVRTCYTALDRNYEDNDENYWYDMRMLLSTCLASFWFTDNQWNNIDSWYTKHFGKFNGP